MTAYLTLFEALANRLEGLSEADLLSCFISWLKIEVRREVLSQQPTTISQAAGLARLQEDKLPDIARSSRPRPSPPPWHSTFVSRPSPKPNSDPPSTATSSQGLLPTHLLSLDLGIFLGWNWMIGVAEGYVSTVTNLGLSSTNVVPVFF